MRPFVIRSFENSIFRIFLQGFFVWRDFPVPLIGNSNSEFKSSDFDIPQCHFPIVAANMLSPLSVRQFSMRANQEQNKTYFFTEKAKATAENPQKEKT